MTWHNHDDNVDLSDVLYVNLSDNDVDLSDNVRSLCWLVRCYVDLSKNVIVVSCMALTGQELILDINFSTNEQETSQQKDLTIQNKEICHYRVYNL